MSANGSTDGSRHMQPFQRGSVPQQDPSRETDSCSAMIYVSFIMYSNETELNGVAKPVMYSHFLWFRF